MIEPRKIVNQPELPELFQKIVENDKKLESLIRSVIIDAPVDDAETITVTEEDWKQLRYLLDLKKDYIRAAEEFLKWNKDKGNTP
jgi:hypothetical protein